jgi:multidrug resistance efflux pump
MKNLQPHFPEFRTDLDITPAVMDEGELRYLIRDPSSDEVFECGEEELFLCSQMDGKTSFKDVLSAFQNHTGITLKIKQLEAFGRRLKSLGLLSTSKDIQTQRNDKQKEIRLGNPDRILGLLDAGLGWCFSLPFIFLSILIIFLGLATAIAFSRELIFGLKFVYVVYGSADILLVVVLGWLVISPLGVLAQGIACKHYGGQVPELNLIMVFKILPRFYFDISDAMWFLGKRARIRVYSAGLLLQLLLWSICIIAWSCTGEGTGLNNFLLTCVITTGLFFFLNLVPLFERDGHLLLKSWLEIPDLHNRAKNWTKSWFFLKPLSEPLSRREIIIFKRYGFFAYAFEIILWCFLLWQMWERLTGSLEGVGACLFIIFLIFRFENTIRSFFMSMPFIGKTSWGEVGGIQMSLLIRLTVLVIFIILMFVPYPFEAGGDARLLPINEQGIRAQVSGEIGVIYVREGQWVSKGQPLAQLVGRDQRKRIEQVQAAIDRAEAKKKMYAGGATPEEIAKAEQEVKAAAKSLEYSSSQAVRAERMFKDNALSEKEYENALRFWDMDRDRLELAKRNLELVQSGFRKEQVETAEAEIRLLEVDLAHAKEDLELITLVSPIEGRIISPRIEEKVGQYLIEGELFAVVEDARKIIAEIEVPEEEAGEIRVGARVKLRTWAFPNTVIDTRVSRIAPVAYEQSRGKIERSYSDREWLIEQDETIREKGKVIRVMCDLEPLDGILKTGMTGYAKIEAEKRPVAVAFTRWLMRFLFIEVWSWIP